MNIAHTVAAAFIGISAAFAALPAMASDPVDGCDQLPTFEEYVEMGLSEDDARRLVASDEATCADQNHEGGVPINNGEGYYTPGTNSYDGGSRIEDR